MRYLIIRYLLILVFCAEVLAAQTFTVVHEKKLGRDHRGEIEITEEGIVYTASKEKDSRAWKYEDIQHFDRIGKGEIRILTYEDQSVWLGRDRSYHFIITDGELTDETFRAVSNRLNKPVTNRVVTETEETLYEVPAKHLHTFGGCEGTLKLTENTILYLTDSAEDARTWRLDRDVQSVASMDSYHLEIRAYDNNRREYSRTGVYRFSLKKPLDQDFYWKLKLRLYGLEQ